MGMVSWWAPTDEEPILKFDIINPEAQYVAEGEQEVDVNASTERLEDSEAATGADQMVIEQGMHYSLS